MIEAIKDIGEYALKSEGKNVNEPLDILIDNPESNSKNPSYKHIVLILIEKVDGNYEYKDLDIEEYSKNKLNHYLYKQGSSNGPDITPTSRVTDISKTFNKKILAWFKPYNKTANDEILNFLVKVGSCLRDNKEKIQRDLEEKYSGINKKEKMVITLKIDGKYIGQYEIFKKILVVESKKRFYSKYGTISKAENKICSVCNKRKAEVYGFVSTYPFYTVDKPGFVSGGFQQRDAWKNYPVCPNCALTLEAGKKYLKDKLKFNFYDFNYYLIPEFISKEVYESRKNVLKLIEEWQDPKFGKRGISRLTQDEKEILKLVSEQKNYLNMNFMFYSESKKEFKILLYIEGVLPSRLRKLFDAKKDVDKIDIFKECFVPVYSKEKRGGRREKVGEKPLEFNFWILPFKFQYGNRLIGEIETKDNNETYKFQEDRVAEHHKYFLDIVNKIFTGKPVDYDFLMKFIMQKIRNDFINGYPTNISVLKGFMLLNYLSKLEIIKIKNVGDLERSVTKMGENELKLSNVSEEISKKANSFFGEFSDFFDSDAKMAIFLEGVLIQFLLNIQYQERKAMPFRVKLKGLKLDEKQIKKLLPEIQNKLEEYGKNYYRSLESIISGHFLSAGNGWELTNDEISFYFVLGMNLSHIFKSEKEKHSDNGGNEDG